MAESSATSVSVLSDITAPEWRCIRCQVALPSPDSTGRPPISCVVEAGGCGRATDGEEDATSTRFFPASWSTAKTELYLIADLDPYQRLVRSFKETFHTDDTAPLDVVLATVLTSRLPGDALWAYVVGPPSSGKTEYLYPLRAADTWAVFVSSMTPNAMISGLRDGKDLLPLLDGKTLIVKDFTTILQMSRDDRDSLFGTLRDAYDGHFAKAFGTRGRVEYDSHFHLVAAVTSAIEDYYSVQGILGQRFVLVRTSFPPVFSSDAERDIEGIREALTMHVREVLEARRDAPVPDVPDTMLEELKQIARDVAILRTHVHRESGTQDVVSFPEPEAPARLTNQFLKLARGIAIARGHEIVSDDDMDLVRRVARDTVPSVRRRVLAALYSGEITIDGIAVAIRLNRRTVERKLEDLVMLDVIDEDSNVKPYRYSVKRSLGFLNISLQTSPVNI